MEDLASACPVPVTEWQGGSFLGLWASTDEICQVVRNWLRWREPGWGIFSLSGWIISEEAETCFGENIFVAQSILGFYGQSKETKCLSTLFRLINCMFGKLLFHLDKTYSQSHCHPAENIRGGQIQLCEGTDCQAETFPPPEVWDHSQEPQANPASSDIWWPNDSEGQVACTEANIWLEEWGGAGGGGRRGSGLREKGASKGTGHETGGWEHIPAIIPLEPWHMKKSRDALEPTSWDIVFSGNHKVAATP